MNYLFNLIYNNMNSFEKCYYSTLVFLKNIFYATIAKQNILKDNKYIIVVRNIDTAVIIIFGTR